MSGKGVAAQKKRRYRSAASQRQARTRRVNWLQWRSQQHMALPSDRLWLLFRFAHLVTHATGSFGTFLSATCSKRVSLQGRQRDIFPLSQLEASECKPSDWSLQRWGLMSQFINAIIGALNWCYGIKAGSSGPARRTAAQADVVHRIVSKALDFEERLQSLAAGSWESFLPDWVPLDVVRPGGAKIGNLCADRVDVLQAAGLCDPTSCLPASVQEVIHSEDTMFRGAPDGLAAYEQVLVEERPEYVRLVARQLRAQQLGLVNTVKAGGGVFAVGKPGGRRQRAVWHGRRVSAAAQPPPKPRHLASPTALALLECPQHGHIRCSKRDASCWFDQLSLPSELQRWMGRPPVTVEELRVIGGLSLDELEHFLLPGESLDASQLFPVSLTWPMGFSWSSYVAQEVLLDICKSSGLDESQVLSCDTATPLSFEQVFAAATDDLMVFSDAGPGHTLKTVRLVDDEFKRRRALRNTSKDVDDQLSATCVGVQLEDGVHLAVPPSRCLAMLFSLLFLLQRQEASPKQVHQLLGVQQWYDLLCRCKLAVYDKVYEFVRDPFDTAVKAVPAIVLFELALGLLLGVFWRVDLRRPFAPLVSATDASTDYGFGASVAEVPISMVRRLARVSEKQGSYVILDGGFAEDVGTHRHGHPHHLELSMDDFVHVFSIRRRHPAHINVLEGEAFVLWLRWFLRSRRRHRTRAVVLVDSAVWLGAAAKGRSSTQLNRLLRKAAALELAGELQVHLVLVPSAENPSDSPSRGVRCTKAKRVPTCVTPCPSRQ
ncbi:UVR8 [Symbiodinium sp. CCMP2592]|nr:UVR8 [Symbiodinium sp. CCMP2592]